MAAAPRFPTFWRVPWPSAKNSGTGNAFSGGYHVLLGGAAEASDSLTGEALRCSKSTYLQGSSLTR